MPLNMLFSTGEKGRMFRGPAGGAKFNRWKLDL